MRQQAIRSLYPSVVTFRGDTAYDGNEVVVAVDESAVTIEAKKIQDAYDNDYARNRQEEYPSIDELVVALWEGVVEERMAAVTSLEGKRQAVKTKYPK